MIETRNILIIGITGSGKSALANVLTDSNDFEESMSNISKTKEFQHGEFEEKGIEYRIIDNIGFADTNKIAVEDILFKIGEGIHSAKEGISQVLFVFKGRFSPEQIATFNLFKSFISESGITKFTTLVRTSFPNFRNEKKCQEDKEKLLNENMEIREIINSCNGIIYIDNPPVSEKSEESDEEEDSDSEEQAEINKEKKKNSREKVLKHLTENCKDLYKIEGWDSVYSIIADYLEGKKKMKKNEVVKKIKEALPVDELITLIEQK